MRWTAPFGVMRGSRQSFGTEILHHHQYPDYQDPPYKLVCELFNAIIHQLSCIPDRTYHRRHVPATLKPVPCDSWRAGGAYPAKLECPGVPRGGLGRRGLCAFAQRQCGRHVDVFDPDDAPLVRWSSMMKSEPCELHWILDDTGGLCNI